MPLSPHRRGPAWSATQSPDCVQQLGVYVEYPGKAAYIRWHVTSHHFPSLVSLVWVKQKGARV
jgi:hypothetical protein